MQSLRTRLARWGFNVFPAYWGTGAHITYISSDWSEIRIRIRLSWRTRNYVGTIFGGSMYGAVDPVYMLMLIKLLGPGYVVWDKAATIQFRRPGRATLYATFVVNRETVDAIRSEVNRAGKTEREFSIDLVDNAGTVHATIGKTIHIRRKGSESST